MTQERKDKYSAGIGTILFHALLVLALFFMALRTPLPLPEEEGVEVNLGYSEVGRMEEQMQPEEIQAPPPEQVQEQIPEQEEAVKETVKEEIVQQETEEAPAIVEKKEKKPEPKKEVEKVVEKPKEEKKPDPIPDPPKEEKKPEPVVDTRLLYTGKKATGSEGNDTQAGGKGIETGTPQADNYSGPGGLGTDGISYNLGDRKASNLPKPTYNSDDQGRINVSIWVDKNGKVIRTEILQKGTTVSDISLRNMAQNAAMKAVFAPDPTAPEIQKGTITYNFIKLK
ncbi:MAG: hypothetical protein JW729_00625 [Bacteroidales bacterium]|nr:hypothetical protein [Bacteroidales bacterium]